MRVDEFNYELPPERIAQRPTERRDASRLLVLDRASGRREHAPFCEIGRWLRAGDLLVVNDTRVLPARLFGRKASGGRVELLLLEPAGEDSRGVTWRCLMDASRHPRPGSSIELDGGLAAAVEGREGDAWRVRFAAGANALRAYVGRHGVMPLPPYIHRGAGVPPLDDAERYQTVFAAQEGAVAAPTAGLHFTPELLEGLERAGIEIGKLTLHVGPGTFLPVRVEEVEEHRMHAERFRLPPELAEAVERARARAARVVAVGTTVTRTLEHQAIDGGRVRPGEGHCALFIYPGYRFRVVDAMVTNFHLPRSTLLMLASAFAGREVLLAAYREAIELEYRFYSYGDAMLVT